MTDEQINTTALREHAGKGWADDCMLPKATVVRIADELDSLRAALPKSFRKERAQLEQEWSELRRLQAQYAAPIQPVDMVLYCPNCGTQHIDEPEEREIDKGSHIDIECSWVNPPHRSHLCHACECIWRPADVPTNGVVSIETKGKADTWPPVSPTAPAQSGEPVYQVKWVGGDWRDVSEKRYEITHPTARRIVYAAPQPFQPAQTGETCKCRRLGDWKGFHHPLCDKATVPATVVLDDERAAEPVVLTNEELNALTKERFGYMHQQYAESFRRLMRTAIESNDKKARAASPQATATETPANLAHAAVRMLNGYAESYDAMARDPQGNGEVHCLSVAQDIRVNMAGWFGAYLTERATATQPAQTERALTFTPLYKKLMRGDVDICEAYLRLKVVGSCPTQEEFCAALEALLANGDDHD